LARGCNGEDFFEEKICNEINAISTDTTAKFQEKEISGKKFVPLDNFPHTGAEN
jgi:hypothetical protein